jgi:hypothetical protein
VAGKGVQPRMVIDGKFSTIGKVITCKAAVAWEAKGELVVQEVQLAPPQPMEVRIKVISTSICGSDILMWSSKASHFPRIFGHEAAGYGLLTFPLYQILCCNFFAIFLLT